MNKEILKIKGYDKFKCTSDKCSLTCCSGWDVSIDDATYDKWKDKNYIENIKTESCDGKNLYFVDKETYEPCPFLDDKGLCKVVTNHGEDFLSSTCHSFPRIENNFEDRVELSLSCACPEVLEIIDKMDMKISMDSMGNLEDNPLELKIRDAITYIMQTQDIAMENKLIIAFEMLLKIIDANEAENILKEIDKYKNQAYLKDVAADYKIAKIDVNESIEEFNYLFLDIVENYKDVAGLDVILEEIYDFADSADISDLAESWKEYKVLFEIPNKLIENIFVSKVIGGCVNNDFEQIAVSMQMIILEYLLVRYSLFLKFAMNGSKEIKVQDIKDYVVAFSRIIENNIEAVIEFFKDDFEEDVWELGYICFITLF